MVRTSAPVSMGNAPLAGRHGNVNGQIIQTNLKDAQAGNMSPEIPELGTTLETHDLRGELVKTNLSEVEGANDNVAALYQANKDRGIIK